MAEMPSSIKDIVTKHGYLSQLAQQGYLLVKDSLASTHDRNGVAEIDSKLAEVTEDPFCDPSAKVEKSSSSDDVTHCCMCSSRITEAESISARTKLRQLKVAWRHKWTTQLKQELILLIQQEDKTDTQTLRAFNTDQAGAAVAAFMSEADDFSDLLSDIMTVTSWNDNDDTSRVSTTRLSASSTKTNKSDLSQKLQRLHRRYDSACTRNQSLIEEVTELKEEILDLQGDVSRLRERINRTRAAPSVEIQNLRQELKDLHQEADQATERYTDPQAFCQRLSQDRDNESVRA